MPATAQPRSYRWKMRAVENEQQVAELAKALNDLPESLARSLYLRGVTTFEAARGFFRPNLDGLHDPFLMADMDVAASRLARAIRTGERVLVYGDYDVDGVTSTTMMLRFLRDHGVSADYFIPDRKIHGYGLCNAGIDVAVEKGAQLIVALDCGITATEQAAYARGLGIDLVICDHHTAGQTLPDAVAVLDPKRPDCGYPYKELSGCGVGFKLIMATLTELGESDQSALRLLDLVSISIAGDIVPIDGENRILMSAGLAMIRESPTIGLSALAEAARFSLSSCSTTDVVFGIAPRINAAGRLQSAARAVELLMAPNITEARRMAHELELINEERRALDRETAKQAEGAARRMLESKTRSGLVLHDPAWHAGVIGITASRIVELFFRPTVMLTTVNGVAKGSARSVHGINVYDALKSCGDLLLTFGGHNYAAGLQLEEENIADFRARFDEAVAGQLTPDLMVPAINIDSPVQLPDITARFWAVLNQFEPFGPSNPKPVFVNKSLQVVGRPSTVGRDGSHLRFTVRQGDEGVALPVIGFGMGPHLERIVESQRTGTDVEMVFSVDENEYRGRKSLQLKARDVRIAP